VNPVLLYFISGESLYSGAALLLAVIAFSPFIHRKLVRVRNLAAWLALIMIIMAAPPFSWAVAGMFLLTFMAWYVAWNSVVIHGRKLRIASALILGLLIIHGVVLEYPHRLLPRIEGAASDHLVVIGDSISAGLAPGIPPWPIVMEQATGIPVRNLSRVGATVADGIGMAAKATPNDRVVLVEIGGNDLIAGLSSGQFEKSLEIVLSRLGSPGRTVVMLELPSLPHRAGYGRVQRRLASKYGVPLIPKRYFVKVISGADATSDGLHLSSEGARRMADLVAQVFSAVLKPTRSGQ
jgi:acyl-CoA thioesterase-1